MNEFAERLERAERRIESLIADNRRLRTLALWGYVAALVCLVAALSAMLR